ncbi:hypothetical protein J3F83DRAFT_743913 [Trichoderma novae-zelandiae]
MYVVVCTWLIHVPYMVDAFSPLDAHTRYTQTQTRWDHGFPALFPVAQVIQKSYQACEANHTGQGGIASAFSANRRLGAGDPGIFWGR